MKKLINSVSILAAIILATFNATAQNSAAATTPKVAIAGADVQQNNTAATDAVTAADKPSNNTSTPPLPPGGKTLTYQKSSNTKEEVYRGEEKMIPRPASISRSPVAVPVTKDLNPQKEEESKPTPKIVPLKG